MSAAKAYNSLYMTETKDNTALLVMDVQPGIIERVANQEGYLTKIEQAIGHAHKQNMPVIYVVVGFRPGFPEISSQNKSFSSTKDSNRQGMINPAPALKPDGDDIVVTKRRVSAFTGSDLEVVLRGQNIRHLILTGIATSGVVLSTLREAADKDYLLTVLSDLCADTDEEVHRVLTEKVFPRQATVITSQEWLNQTKA
jgi:nicotinamidase-related amidase